MNEGHRTAQGQEHTLLDSFVQLLEHFLLCQGLRNGGEVLQGDNDLFLVLLDLLFSL